MKFLITVAFFSSFLGFSQQKDSPKLVVGIVVDQMCYDYLYRFYDKFSEGGFKKLMEKGTNCRNMQYNYIPTYTGPGHASIYTGTTPSNHGIVANDWYHRESKMIVNCVGDTNQSTIGNPESIFGKYSPKRLKALTITDQLKMTYPDSKVISMSIKNRGAILPGGHLSDGSYWYDFQSGDFITSSYFKESLPEWIKSFNDEGRVQDLLSQNWDTYLPISEYHESGPDNSPYEHLLPGKSTPEFPYNLSSFKDSSNAYELFVYTPHANTYLTDFAIRSIGAEGLGMDNQTDFLAISYSTPDIIGHAFGPYSKEIEDTYIRLDLELAKLITNLEKLVGKKDFVLFLTADHAVVPVPQMFIDQKMPGGYVFLDEYLIDLKQKMIGRFGADLVEAMENQNLYLNHDRIDSLRLSLNDIASWTANEIRSWKNVKRVFLGHELYNATYDDEWMDMVRSGYHPMESGDVIFILEPGFLPKSVDSEIARKGTSHGSAYSYDTHVPMLWYGKGITPGETFRQMQITDITPTLAHLLYLQLPNATTGNPIAELLK